MSRGRDAQISMPGEECEGPPPSKCVKFLYYTWRFCSVIFSHFIMICLVIAYSILGAFTFRWLEVEHEIKIKESIKWIRGNVTQDIWTMTNDNDVLRQEGWTGDVSHKLKEFENDILHAMKHEGWDGIEGHDRIQWTFTGALFYSIIVITTIGYGHIAPKTQSGKVVTIFYAILGIPLMLLCLSNIGDVMASSFRFLYWRVCCYVCTRPPKRRRRHRALSRHPSMHRSVRGRGMSTRRRARPLSSALEPHSYSDTECRYRDSGYATTPGSTKTKKPTPARVRSQPPVTHRHGPGEGMKRTRSFQTEAERSPAPHRRHNRDHFPDEALEEEEFPKISLPLRDLKSALYDLDRHERCRPGDLRSTSLPRPPRHHRDHRRNFDYRDRDRDPYCRDRERNEMHSLGDVDYDNFRERQARLRRNVEEYEDREYDYDPDDDFDADRPGARRQYDRERGGDRRQEYYDRAAEREYPDYCEPERGRARSMMYEAERRCYDDDMPPRRQYRRLDTRDETGRNPPYRCSMSPERRSRRRCRSEMPPAPAPLRRRELADDEWSDDGELDYDLLHQARRRDLLAGWTSRQSELQLQGAESAKPQIKPVPIWLCVCLVVSYIIAGTFLFHEWESWSYLDSAYFCFITLTTIGFGDFVPAQGIKSDAAAESIALCSLYLLFGISLLAMSFNLVQEEVISNVRAVAKKLGIIKSDGEESESE